MTWKKYYLIWWSSVIKLEILYKIKTPKSSTKLKKVIFFKFNSCVVYRNDIYDYFNITNIIYLSYVTAIIVFKKCVNNFHNSLDFQWLTGKLHASN